MTPSERTALIQKLKSLGPHLSPWTVKAILRPHRKDGALTLLDLPDATLKAIWSQWGHLVQ